MSEYTISLNNGEQKLPVKHGISLIAGLSAHNIYVPAVCGGGGACAYCKVIVQAGGGEATPLENTLLTPEESKRGTRLACQVIVREDLAIKIPKQMLKARLFKGVIVKKQSLTYDIVGLRIKLLEPESISFVAGQHVKLISRSYAEKSGVMRNYSISSSASDDRHIELIIRRVPNGTCTTWVFDHLAEGQHIDFAGPYGSFKLHESQAPMIFIAGGSGLSSIWSLIHELIEKGNQRPTTLFFGAQTQRDLYHVAELAALQQKYAWFRFIPALSNEPADSDWSGERGLITDVVDRLMPSTAGYEAYLCGSPGMLDACMAVLKKNGTPSDAIFFDKFA